MPTNEPDDEGSVTQERNRELNKLLSEDNSQKFKKLGEAMMRQFQEDMDRHMLKSFEERVKEGIRDELRKRNK